jgi:diguanylate cyclase (GGDEF)-like protein
MLPEVKMSSSAFKLWREANDVHARSRFGGFYYLLAWCLLWLTSRSPTQNLWLWLAGGLLLLLFVALRILHEPREQRGEIGLQHWLRQHWLLMLLQALLWGLMLAGVELSQALDVSHLMVMLNVVVFATAMAFTYPMRRGPCALAMLLIYLPATAVKFWQERGTPGESVALLIYLAYMMLFLYRWHREYRIGLEREMRLRQHSEELDQRSRTDALTGLGNRYQFNVLLANWLASLRRQHSPLALVLLDIDWFKQVNDRHGHSAGDLCLHLFAERMRKVFRRDSDILLRLGGEEFAVLMPHTSLEQALQLAERFRCELEQEPLQLPALSLSITCSIGVGDYLPLCDDSPEGFYKRVDDALYQAKSKGRNRVELA